MKNQLIISCSPLKKGAFTSKLRTICASVFRNLGDAVYLKELYGSGFDPVISREDILGHQTGQYSLEVLQEQELIKWANTITFIYPLYQLAMPALLKGYIDKV